MNVEIEALFNKAKLSLEAAKSLQADGYFDFAASRAYYAMFYATQALLLSRRKSYSSHAAVIAAFGKEFAKSGEMDAKFHRWLIDAQDIRNLGDYGIDLSISEEQCEQLLNWADTYLHAADMYYSDH